MWNLSNRLLSSRRVNGGPPLFALIVFFASGFAALLYQVVWQRLLVFFSGADVHSVTIIVASFMAGLGCGSLTGGWLADRLGPRTSLLAFAVAELAVGLFGLISKPLYYDLLYTRLPHLAGAPGVAAFVLLASLWWPTFFMGLSLPLLARSFTATVGAAGGVVGSLYGWNTLGAAVGAFVCTWLLLPLLGLERLLIVGVGLNIACATSAVLLRDRWASIDEEAASLGRTAPQDGAKSLERLPFWIWALIYALTGFIALALEIVWFRVLGVLLKSTAFTFGTLLGVYLAGLGAGSALAARLVERSQRPGATFLAVHYVVTLYAAVSIVALVALIGSGHPVRLVRYLSGNEPVNVAQMVRLFRELSTPGAASSLFEFAVLYLAVPAVLVGPPTILMGLSFPLLQRATQVDFARVGRRVGILLFSNIAGSTAGAMAAGWVLLPVLGTSGTLRTLVGMGALLAVPFAFVRWARALRTQVVVTLAAVIATGIAALAIPDAETLWARLHGTETKQVLLAEDGSGLFLLKASGSDFSRDITVFVNGLSQSWIPYGQGHTVLGALPTLIHPAPVDIAIIGLGSGDTAVAAAGRTEVRRLVCVEIIGAQLGLLTRLAHAEAYDGLLKLVTDRRIDHVVGDGRAYLARSVRLFDVIEADALRPTSAYAGNLYSREYFALLRRRLKPGGFAVTWAPTERIRRTFVSVFPYVLGLDEIYIGSDAPIPFQPSIVAKRAAAVRSYYAAAGIDIEALVRPYLEVPPRLFGPDFDRSGVGDLNTDTFPRDEFDLEY